MTITDPGAQAQEVDHAEASSVKRRAAVGALLVGGRTFAVRFISLAGNLALARLLTPEDFGAVAVGYVVVLIGQTLFDGGLGAALVRGPVKPTREHLSTLLTTQLVLSSLIVLGIELVAVATGLDDPVIMVTLAMALSMPAQAIRAPQVVVLERDLRYAPLVRVEIAEAIVYNVWAVGAVALGAGVWGIATGVVAKTVIGAGILIATAGLGWVTPRFSMTRLREMLKFGAAYQAMGLAAVGRDQLLNVLIGLSGGLYALGLWSFAYRLIQPFNGVFETLRHVSYPGMARLRDTGADTADIAALALRITTVATALLIVPAVATARVAIPLVFGQDWAPAADAFALTMLSLLLAGPISAACAGFLLSEGKAGVVLQMIITAAVVEIAAYAVLSPELGVTAVGAGAVVAAFVNAFTYRLTLHRLGHDLDFASSLARPLGCALAAAAIGYLVTNAFEPSWPVFALGLLASLGSLIALDTLFCRQAGRELLATARRMGGRAEESS